jgi:hypothetical protein
MGTIIFAQYDHSLEKVDALDTHRKELAEHIKESLGEKKAAALAKERWAVGKWSIYFKRFLINITVMATLGLSCWAIYEATQAFSSSDGFLVGC